jgi:hypothetical protein
MTELNSGHDIVFIVGCPRSGTTYLQRLLAAHPQIKTGQESHVFYLVGPLFRLWKAQMKAMDTDPRGGVGLPCYFEEKEFLFILRGFLSDLLNPMVDSLKKNEVFVEKSPSHALYLDAIYELLPEARIIHVLRDARDVVASLLAASRSWGKHWAPETPKKAADLWRKHITQISECSQYLPNNIFHETRYEHLVFNPKKSLQEIGDFIGIVWSEQLLDAAISQNEREIARITGGTKIPVGGPAGLLSKKIVMEPFDFIRKGFPGSWKSDLNLLEKIIVWSITRSAMNEVGYTWKFPW